MLQKRSKNLYTFCAQVLNNQYSHTPVLKNEVLEYLSPHKGDVIIDATLGFGGHAREILKVIGPEGLLIGIDQDEESLEIAKANLQSFPHTLFFHSNFENLEEIVEASRKKGVKEINGILFDLGISSYSIENPSRGFSFSREGPLDMRFDRRTSLTASHIINQWSYEKLIQLFRTYGEESTKRSQFITKAILERRRKSPFRTTTDLASLIASLSPAKIRGIHPATRIFQALRIGVNRELEVLVIALSKAITLIAPGGRIVVISFHSLEDRIVKNIFRQFSKEEAEASRVKILTKKPIIPSRREVYENPRSRSAKLRAAIRRSD